MLHKLRRAMIRPGRDRLSGTVEVDETYWGAEEEGVVGRLTQDKALVIVAAQHDGQRRIGRIRMARIPDLTPDQMDKMDAMRVTHLKTVLPIRTDIQVAEIELDALWRADKLDHKKIIAKVTEIGGLRQKLELAMVNHRIDTYNLLTPDQQKAVRKMRLGRGRGMTRGQGRGMRGGMKGTGAPGPEGPRDLPD